jgi:hypothetical protein
MHINVKEKIMEKTEGFFKNHADTLAIIGVNLALFALLLTLCITNSHRIDAANARSDQLYVEFCQLIKDVRK